MSLEAAFNGRPPLAAVQVMLTATVSPLGEIERLWIEGRSLSGEDVVLFPLTPAHDSLSFEELVEAAAYWTFLLQDNLRTPERP